MTTDLPGTFSTFSISPRSFATSIDVRASAANLKNMSRRIRRRSDAKLRTSAREMVSELLELSAHAAAAYFIAEQVKTETQKGKSKQPNVQTIETRERERRVFDRSGNARTGRTPSILLT